MWIVMCLENQPKGRLPTITWHIRYCCEAKKKCKRTNCLGIIAIILGILFAGIIGVIIGAALAETILAALAAIIVLAITFFVLLILTIILLLCKKHKDC